MNDCAIKVLFAHICFFSSLILVDTDFLCSSLFSLWIENIFRYVSCVSLNLSLMYSLYLHGTNLRIWMHSAYHNYLEREKKHLSFGPVYENIQIYFTNSTMISYIFHIYFFVLHILFFSHIFHWAPNLLSCFWRAAISAQRKNHLF